MNNKKNEELLDKKCNCECGDDCSCYEGECNCDENCSCTENLNDILENATEEEFCGTYTVDFDCPFDELEDIDCCYELDGKKLALIGLGAALAGGAICYAVKKKKKNKSKKK